LSGPVKELPDDRDDAARAVTGKRTEGVLFWHLASPDGTRITLRQLREEAKQQRAKPKR